MLAHLGAAAREARKHERRRQIEIANRLDVTEDTISNFERGRNWPRDPDATISAYAHELNIDPLELWEEALRRWHDS